MIDYAELLRSEQASLGWHLVELDVVRRCFALGFLRRVTRGRHKNQVVTSSPGSGSKPEHLETGLFEAYVRVHAFRTYRDLHPMQHEGVWAAFFGSSGLGALEAGLERQARAIGTWLGFTTTIWNDLGTEFIDLWDIFRDDVDTDEAYESFVQFYLHCQDAREVIEPDDSPKGIIKKILAVAVQFSPSRRTTFDPGGPAEHALGAVGIDRESVSSLPRLFAQWEGIRTIWTTHVRGPKKKVSHVSDFPTVDAFEGINNVARFLESGPKVDAELMSFLLALLKAGSVELTIDEPDIRGSFRIEVAETEANQIRLRPHILLGTRANLGLLTQVVLCHEIAHFVLHSRWLAELRLMWHLGDKMGLREPSRSRAMLAEIDDAALHLTGFHSAMEVAADAFAAEVLLPDSDLMMLKATMSLGGGFRIFDFHEAIRLKLGFPQGKLSVAGVDDEYADRFWRFVDDRIGFGHVLVPVLSSRGELRELVFGFSRERVEDTLEYLWRTIAAIATGDDTASRGGRRRKPLSFSYDGIRCERRKRTAR